MLWPTIAAIATPAGVGGVAIIRISGPEARVIADGCLRLRGRWKPRHAHLADILDAEGKLLDSGLAIWMPAPASYTGEDTVEFHGHGGPYVVRRVLDRVVDCGAALAAPGEFTRRAVLHGKLDLAQAEAVGDLLAARTETGLRQAVTVLEGALSKPLRDVREALMALVAHLEAGIDFPDEVEVPEPAWFHAQVTAVVERVTALIATATAGQIYREGATVALAGRPNVGKSSLLNALLRHDRAIVTPFAGTTRDTVAEACDLGGVLVQLVDTAGIRAAADPVEQLGIARSRDAIATAMLTLLVYDGSEGWTAEDEAVLPEIAGPVLLVANKADRGRTPGPEALAVSALTGDGLAALEAAVQAQVLSGLPPPTQATVNARQRACLVRAREALAQARQTVDAGLGLDCLTIDLRAALMAVGDVSGDGFTETVLDAVFARFCVGK